MGVFCDSSRRGFLRFRPPEDSAMGFQADHCGVVFVIACICLLSFLSSKVLFVACLPGEGGARGILFYQTGDISFGVGFVVSYISLYSIIPCVMSSIEFLFSFVRFFQFSDRGIADEEEIFVAIRVAVSMTNNPLTASLTFIYILHAQSNIFNCVDVAICRVESHLTFDRRC